MLFDLSFLISILPALTVGLGITVKATAGGYVLALIIGMVLAMMRRCDIKIIRGLCYGYVALIRCTPLLVQLYVAYYVLPQIGLKFDALLTGICVLGLYIGAYLSEVFRAAIEALPRGQWEAADSLGLSNLIKWRKIIGPQLLPLLIAPMGNYLIGMFKETPLLAAITVLDVFGTANDIAGQSYRYIEPYTVAAVMLLGISLIAAVSVRLGERYFLRYRARGSGNLKA